jgi:hypothetical protein
MPTWCSLARRHLATTDRLFGAVRPIVGGGYLGIRKENRETEQQRGWDVPYGLLRNKVIY